jgi:predicted alpha/beta superfamily hydrolase
LNYDSTKSYPVLYVLDAEWRLDLIRPIAYDMAGNKRIPHHIIIGIPHIDWEFKRGIDLTFSHTRNEYDGSATDSTEYNSLNSGGGMLFFHYLKDELVPDVNKRYATSGFNILVGHSYGGYFGSYILPLEHSFSAFQLYDPSIWYSDAEAIKHVMLHLNKSRQAHVFIAYQNDPAFHYKKIKKLIKTFVSYPNIRLTHKEYYGETHNSLFMYSFIDGMKVLYPKPTQKGKSL